MNSGSRKQFKEIVQHFRLASEANQEAVVADYMALINQQAQNCQPLMPVLGFCMERAGSRERAEAIFNWVVSNSDVAYTLTPKIVPALRSGYPELKAVCFKHAIIPIKASEHIITFCGTNPYDLDGIMQVGAQLPNQNNQFPTFSLSEPEKILAALQQFS